MLDSSGFKNFNPRPCVRGDKPKPVDPVRVVETAGKYVGNKYVANTFGGATI